MEWLLLITAYELLGFRKYRVGNRQLWHYGCIAIGEISADVPSIAGAAPQLASVTPLARRKCGSLTDLLSRLDRAIASAAETSITVDEINPPGGFKPPAEDKPTRPWADLSGRLLLEDGDLVYTTAPASGEPVEAGDVVTGGIDELEEFAHAINAVAPR